MNKDQFNNIMARAQQLMLDENFNRKVEKNASTYAGKNSGTYGSDSDISLLESQVFGSGNEPKKQIQMIQQQTNTGNKRGLEALPEFMRESFAKMPPIQGDISDVDPLSTLTQNLAIKPQETQRNVLNENIIPQNNGGIDYSLIKTIIDESISRQLKTINESSGPSFKGMRFVNGNTFQFLDNKGNLYEGVLKLKKRAKQ